MESIIFLLAILGAVAVVFWLMHRSTSKKSVDLSKKHYKHQPLGSSTAAHSVTPGNNVLSHNAEIWERRRKKAHSLSQTQSDNHGHIKFKTEREYDGYSRRDRQHLNPARVKKEATTDDLSMTSIKFEAGSPAEKAQAKS
jgi:alkylated DNA repair dioxygenase AlkB